MGIFKKPDYFDIGKNGTPEQFLKEYEKASNQIEGSKIDALVAGAVQAFHEDRPENIQTILLKADTIKCLSWDEPVTTILSELSEKSDDRLADINLALKKIPPEDRKETLNKTLKTAVKAQIGNIAKETFSVALLESGADVSAEILKLAAVYNSPSFVKLVHEKGASFDEALSLMEQEKWGPVAIDRLKFYKEAMTKPATEELSPQVVELFQHMQETIDDLTGQLKAARQPQEKPTQRPSAAPKFDFRKF